MLNTQNVSLTNSTPLHHYLTRDKLEENKKYFLYLIKKKYKKGKMKKTHLLKQTSLWLIMGTAFLSVLLVVPLTSNFIDDTKKYLLFFSSILVLFLFIFKTFKQKAINITVSPITGSLIFFGLATLASSFFTNNYPVEALLGLGGVYLATTIIAIFGGSLIPKNSINKFIISLSVTSIILVASTLLQMTGFGPAQLINKTLNANLPTNLLFNLTGSSFIALQVLLVTLVGVVSLVVNKKKLSTFNLVTIIVSVLGIGIYSWSLLPNQPAHLVLPKLSTSWSIMLDTIRNPKFALIGVGPNSYANVYTKFKPMWVNNSSQWNTVFSQATIFPLTLLSTMGVIGLTTWGFLVNKIFRMRKRSLASTKPLLNLVIASLILQLIFPVSVTLLTIQAVAIALVIANEKHRLPLLQLQALKLKILNKIGVNKKAQQSMNISFYSFVVIMFLATSTLLYFTAQTYLANTMMMKSSIALADNKIVQAYELQKQAIAKNPYLDSFRRDYSNTNLNIAIALSNKADITDQEKQQVSVLLRQSIKEAKAGTTLDPMKSSNWVNLAQIYNNLIGTSDDAVSWTVQTYITAIELDPNNPVLRIDLANVFSTQENYSQAVSILSQAIAIKPDLPASHFNMGLTLEKIATPESYREARKSYQTTLTLLDPSSQEYILVNKKIEELEKLMKEKGVELEPKTEEVTEQQPTQEQPTTPSITQQALDEVNPSTEEDNDAKAEVTNLAEELEETN